MSDRDRNNGDNDMITEIEADEVDRFLSIFINSADKSNGDFSFPIVLNVSGFLVSGLIIGAKEYYETFADTYFQDPSITKYGEKLKKDLSELVSDDGFVSSIDKIHLKDAKFFHPSGKPIPTNMGVLWRGRLSEIAGFSFGSLSPLNEEDTKK